MIEKRVLQKLFYKLPVPINWVRLFYFLAPDSAYLTPGGTGQVNFIFILVRPLGTIGKFSLLPFTQGEEETSNYWCVNLI